MHPLDYAGRGDNRLTGDVRLPNLFQDLATSPERWVGYDGWSLTGGFIAGSGYAAPANDSDYILGRDGVWGTADDLVANDFRDALLDDPLETIVDLDSALRPDDQIFGVQDLIPAHLYATADLSTDGVSERLKGLAPFAFADSPQAFPSNASRSDRTTTLTNTLRHFPIREPFGGDGRAGDPGIDDDGDGATDEWDEVLFSTGDGELHMRAWEWSADTDGADSNNDGYRDGDRFLEFPPHMAQRLLVANRTVRQTRFGRRFVDC